MGLLHEEKFSKLRSDIVKSFSQFTQFNDKIKKTQRHHYNVGFITI